MSKIISAPCPTANCGYVGMIEVYDLMNKDDENTAYSYAASQLNKRMSRDHKDGKHDNLCKLCGLPQSRCKDGECDEQ